MTMTTEPSTLAERYRQEAIRQTVACNYCGKPIVWGTFTEGAKVIKGSRIPLDADPSPGGNVLLTVTVEIVEGKKGGKRDIRRDVLTATVLGTLTRRQAFEAQNHRLYSVHKLTCPKSAEWSKPKRAAAVARPRRR